MQVALSIYVPQLEGVCPYLNTTLREQIEHMHKMSSCLLYANLGANKMKITTVKGRL